jgi:NAD-dependent DNA ligase
VTIRRTASTINDTELDQLYDELAALDQPTPTAATQATNDQEQP